MSRIAQASRGRSVASASRQALPAQRSPVADGDRPLFSLASVPALPGAGLARSADPGPPAPSSAPMSASAPLPITAADDPAEAEADRAADRVMSGQTVRLSARHGPALERKCEACEEEESLQREAEGAGAASAGEAAPPVVHQVLAQAGRPLDSTLRADLEPRMGADFGNVRIHDDPLAAQSARAVRARAYAVGPHIAFAAGRFAPDRAAGRRLLVHELAHVAQRGGMRLARVWESAPAGTCPAAEPDRWLEKVVIDQEKAQSVTLHWSDGALESSITSTGKGHCCVDSAANPSGTACSVTESRRNGSNCTPITEGRGERITDHYVSYNGWDFWSTFVPARGIGLHTHHTVTGTPLSHGCVRLPRETARKIFCGARQNQTRVEVRGFSRPDCAEPEVQAEWQGDFSSATAVSDGEPLDQRRIIEGNRRESRRILREAYGRDLNDSEMQQGVGGQLDIPRCASTAAEPDVEERRAIPETGAGANVPTDAVGDISAGGFEPMIPAFSGALAGAASLRQARSLVTTHGRRLWERATQRARGPGGVTDDRPLYWTRLALTRTLRQWAPRFTLSAADRNALIDQLERSSRGMTSVDFPTVAGQKKIVISGFDPFGFDLADYGLTRASNPAGAAALALDGADLTNGPHRARVESVVFPVRFSAFSAGLVESVFTPFLSGPRRVDMVMTIGMGGSSYEVEEYAGRARGPGIADNAGVAAGSSAPPAGLGAGPEFIHGSLPASARAAVGRTAPNAAETGVEEVRPGGTAPVHSAAGPTAGSTAVEGSGGAFLCNEAMYRTTLLASGASAPVPAGHLHVPFLPPVSGTVTVQQFTAARDTIVATVRSILTATLPDI
jgi:pyrrolidone-carboxylate peptidase